MLFESIKGFKNKLFHRGSVPSSHAADRDAGACNGDAGHLIAMKQLINDAFEAGKGGRQRCSGLGNQLDDSFTAEPR